MSLVNKIWLKLFYQRVGADQFGNIYYKSKNTNYLGKNKRFVMYNGLDESSKVPPMWHAWLHYLCDDVPSIQGEKEHEWQQKFLPNLTGTKYSYSPAIKKNKIAPNYQSWQPK